MVKNFDDWEVLPTKVTDELGEKLDAELKKRLHEEVDDMFLQSWLPAYKYANSHFMNWVTELIKNKSIGLRVNDNNVFLVIDFVPEDYDNEFAISIPVASLAEETKDWYCEEDDDEANEQDKSDKSKIAAALRMLADEIEA